MSIVQVNADGYQITNRATVFSPRFPRSYDINDGPETDPDAPRVNADTFCDCVCSG